MTTVSVLVEYGPHRRCRYFEDADSVEQALSQLRPFLQEMTPPDCQPAILKAHIHREHEEPAT